MRVFLLLALTCVVGLGCASKQSKGASDSPGQGADTDGGNWHQEHQRPTNGATPYLDTDPNRDTGARGGSDVTPDGMGFGRGSASDEENPSEFLQGHPAFEDEEPGSTGFRELYDANSLYPYGPKLIGPARTAQSLSI